MRVALAFVPGPALLLVAAMSGCSGSSGTAAPSAGSSSDPGAQIYDQHCAPCHRDDGSGVPAVYPSLAGSPVVNGDPVELTRWVLLGVRPDSMPAGRYATKMLAFPWMKNEDAAVLFSYLRAHFGNFAAPVGTAAVAGARP